MSRRCHTVLKYFGLAVILSIIVLLYFCVTYSNPFDRQVVHSGIQSTANSKVGLKIAAANTSLPLLLADHVGNPVVTTTVKCSESNSTSKVLIIGASTGIGSAITLDLVKSFNVVPIETGNVHLFSSSQNRNWEELSDIGIVDPLVIQSTELKSAIDELKPFDHVIYIPRNVYDSLVDSTVSKVEGIEDLEFVVSLLEAVKDFLDVRVTMVTKPGNRLSSMQSAWLASLENSLKTYCNLYKVKTAFIRVEGTRVDLQQDTNAYNDLLSTVRCVMGSDAETIDIDSAVVSSSQPALLPPAKKNLQKGNTVFSTYFTTIQNPQYAITIPKDKFVFMQDWLVSANKLGIQAVVFHDSLSDGFIKRIHQKFDNVVFEKVHGFKGRTPNDYRFYLQYNYLQAHPEISNIILSDIRDVTFFEDPFEVMEVIGNYLYVGVDVGYYTNSWSHSYPRAVINYCYRKEANTIAVTADPFYNAGVIGGTRDLMLKFLKLVTESLNGTPRGRNCNMATVTIIAHKHFRDEAFSGYPFQSAFKMDIPGPQGLAVKHKIEHKNL